MMSTWLFHKSLSWHDRFIKVAHVKIYNHGTTASSTSPMWNPTTMARSLHQRRPCGVDENPHKKYIVDCFIYVGGVQPLILKIKEKRHALSMVYLKSMV